MINPWTLIIALGAFVAWRWLKSEKKRVAGELNRTRAGGKAKPIELERDKDGVYRPRDDA
ncbi:MAG: hypothetical protein R3D43_06245 [Tepidamorphaceae bacterium]|nr:hypothetical protein [Rhodobiaceae bacterium]MCC0049469.1 hypothetical protein [Rhodobiaceae bacterium]